jgi:hypothetical protein
MPDGSEIPAPKRIRMFPAEWMSQLATLGSSSTKFIEVVTSS